MIRYYLFLDDRRSLHQISAMTNDSSYIEKEWIVVKSYNEFVSTIEEMFKRKYFPLLISFDNDLGYEIPEDEKTGYDCAKWLVDFCMDNDLEFPEYKVHSQNPVGHKNITSYLENYLKYSKQK